MATSNYADQCPGIHIGGFVLSRKASPGEKTIETINQYLPHIFPGRKETGNGESLEYLKTLVRIILDDIAKRFANKYSF